MVTSRDPYSFLAKWFTRFHRNSLFHSRLFSKQFKNSYATCINAYCWCCTNTNHCDLMKDEWVISRVFQKSNTTSGGSAMSASSGSKKTRMNTTTSTLCPEPSSPSSVYLPPLLDSSPYATTTFTGRNNCSYDSTPKKEHVSCFSTIAAATAAVVSPNNFTNASFDLPPSQPLGTDPFARFQRNVGVSAFPSLRSLQDNLQLPFFFPPAAQPFSGGGSGDLLWPMPEEQRLADAASNVPLGVSELDCMWGY